MSHPKPGAQSPNPVTAILVVTLGLLVYFPTWVSLEGRWHTLSETDSHGYLIVAISLFLIFRYSARANNGSTDDFRGVALLAMVVASLGWLLAYFANVLLVQAAVLPAIVLLAVIAMLGYPAARPFVFPVLFLYFATPVWSAFIVPLQEGTISVVSWFLVCIQVPALVDGEMVYLPSGAFRIESGCAGLHFVVVAFALSALYGYLYFNRHRSRALFAGIAVLAAIVVNWIRVATIIVAGYATDMQHYLVSVDHYYFGWVLFGAMLIPLYFIAQTIEGRDRLALARRPVESRAKEPERRNVPPRFVSVVLLFCAMPAFGYMIDSASEARPGAAINAPSVLGDWVWLPGNSPNWSPKFPGVQSELSGEYRRGEDDIHFYANHYARQSQGKELIGANSRLLALSDVRVVSTEIVSPDWPGANGRQVGYRRTIAAHRTGVQQIVISWYQVGGDRYVSRVDVKLFELLARIRGNSGSGIVAFKMDCASNCGKEDLILTAFVAAHARKVIWHDAADESQPMQN